MGNDPLNFYVVNQRTKTLQFRFHLGSLEERQPADWKKKLSRAESMFHGNPTTIAP